VRSLDAKGVAPLAAKAAALGTMGDPKEIIRTIDAGHAALGEYKAPPTGQRPPAPA